MIKKLNTKIVKLVYKRDFFDISVMKPGRKSVATIFNDGTVVFKEYEPMSRRAQSVRRGKRSVEDFKTLCEKIAGCIESADRLDSYVDDSTEELKIFYEFGRVQRMDRGLGNEDLHIGDIMREFLDRVVLDTSMGSRI